MSFIAYTEDCRVVGRMVLDNDRFSDVLNATDDLVLRDVLVESLTDGRQARTDRLVVARDELIAAHADGPRGNPARRTHTIPYPVAVRSGSFEIRGYLHARPGAEPLASARYRKPMIPLTDATIEYLAAGTPRRVSMETIVINRSTAEWIRPIPDHEVRWMGRSTPAIGRRRPGVGTDEIT